MARKRRDEPTAPGDRASAPGEPEPRLDQTGIIRSAEALKAISHPLRQRLLEGFARAPTTTKQLAEVLGEKPTRLYHHVHTLERAGLIRLVETRPNRGTTEKYYSAVARRFRIDPTALSSGSEGLEIEASPALGLISGLLLNLETELTELFAAAAATDREDPDSTSADLEEGVLARLEVRGTPEEIGRIRERLQNLLTEIEAHAVERSSGDDPAETGEDATPHRLVLMWYPLSS